MQFDAPQFSAHDFCGRARIFPLPNLVLFPYVVQALHIFEPRYRQMLRDAMRGDKLIAMGLLQDGWQQDYEGRPPLHPVVCLGRVVTQFRNDDGTSNILLVGLRRARLVRELDQERSYREAEVELLDDVYETDEVQVQKRLHDKLLNGFRQIIPDNPTTREQLDQLLGVHIPLGMLTDLVAYSLQMHIRRKQALLAEVIVEKRAKTLIRQLQQVCPEGSDATDPTKFPPPFSEN